jgi:small subunit ribosomal protein S28e
MSTSAVVTHLLGRMGVKGVSKVRCKVLEGDDKDKIITRNVLGPVRTGDIVLLKDTTMDASSRFQRKG